jgi:hypothetical protein
MRLSSSMGVEAVALTHPPATQDSTGIVHNSLRCNQQSDSESSFGQVQTHKVPPEALAIFMGHPDTMKNNREKYALQDQTTKVALEALKKKSNRPVTMWNYYVQCQVQEHTKEITPEAMPNYLSIKSHLHLSPSRKRQSQDSVRSRPILLNEVCHSFNRCHRTNAE